MQGRDWDGDGQGRGRHTRQARDARRRSERRDTQQSLDRQDRHDQARVNDLTTGTGTSDAGSDVSKARLAVAVPPRGEAWQSRTDETGRAALVDRRPVLAPRRMGQGLTAGAGELDQLLHELLHASPLGRARDQLPRRVPGVGPALARASCWPICPRWARGRSSSSPPWWDGRRSTGTVAPGAAVALFGVAASTCALPSPGRRWWACDTLPSSKHATNGWEPAANPRRWP